MLSPLAGFGSGLESGSGTSGAPETGSRGTKLMFKSNSTTSCTVREGSRGVCGRPGCVVGLWVWCRLSGPRVFSLMGCNVVFGAVASSEELDSFDSEDSELDAVNR